MKFTIPTSFDKMTLRDIFQHLKLPKKELHQLNMSKEITINDAQATLQSEVHVGDVVHIPTGDAQSNYIPSYRHAQIYYEDDALAVVLKPKGVKTHPNHLKEANTLMNHVIYTIDSDYVEPVQRLEQDAIGLVVVAKNPIVKKILDRMLEENEMSRVYKVRVKSLLPIKPQTIDTPIGKDKFQSNKRRVSPTGQRAVTHILDSKQISEGVYELSITLETSRTHQIRVHLAEIGHPVIGDGLYGDDISGKLQIHSNVLTFTHPLSQETITCTIADDDLK